MKSNLLVSIINWNNSKATNLCLQSIAHIDKAKQPDIILFDNHSQKEVLRIDPEITGSLRSLEIVYNDENLGFAAAHNKAIKKAIDTYAYVCLLNNDTSVQPDSFDKLTHAIEENNADAACPTICFMDEPSKVWYGGGQINLRTATTAHDHLAEDIEVLKDERVQETNFLTGCCLMIKLDPAKLETLLIDEGYFLYWEDADWSVKNIQAGQKLVYVPDSLVLHAASSSLGMRSTTYAYYNLRNRLLFAKQWSGKYFWLIFLDNCILGIKYYLLGLRHGKSPKLARGIYWAIVDGIKGADGKESRGIQA